MKVSELIDALKLMPANAQVLVQGYEDGFDNIKTVREISVVKNPQTHDWAGEYDEPSRENDKKVFAAVVIFGNRR